MRLTYKDAIATLLAAAVAAVTLAVVQGRGWPALGSPRAGMVALGILGMAMCTAGARTDEMADKARMRGPGLITGSTRGGTAGIVLIVALVVGTEGWLIALAANLLVLWVFTTARHAVVPWPPRVAGRLAGVN
jgi:hypothetical protein